MIEISKNANINYLAKIVKINSLNNVPNSDNLVMTLIDGNIIISNKDSIKVGDIVVYFPVESKISDWYLKKNNLYRDLMLNENPNIRGFFELNGRVRCVKLRGQISAGFIMPIHSLDIIVTNELIGQEFDTVNGEIIVQKYVNREVKVTTSNSQRGGKRNKHCKNVTKVIDSQFRFHIDTPQLPKNLGHFGANTPISITRKVHGTSGISSLVLCNFNLKPACKIVSWINNNILYPLINPFCKNAGISDVVDQRYDYIHSSRKVIKNDTPHPGFYGVDVWKYADDVVKPCLIDGMTIYYEIIGYLPDGKMIQKDYPYGFKNPLHTENYKYGENFGIQVYKITMTNVQGVVVEFNSQMVRDFCKSRNLTPITEYYRGTVGEFISKFGTTPDEKDIVSVLESIDEDDIIREKFLNTLSSKYLNRLALDCGPNIPDEGIVVRIEDLDLQVFKLKSPNFLLKETKELDKGDVNIEDVEV